MPEANEMQTVVVTLRKNGDLVIDDEGKPLTVAHYDRVKGHLEFETREWSVKLYNQITGAIGSIAKGKIGADPSNLVIRTMGIKGQAQSPAVDRKGVPPRPRFGPNGDAAGDIFDWYIKYRREEAIIRYRLYLDEKGEPVRLPCRRKKVSVVELRNVDNEDLPWQDLSKKHRERGPVFQEGEWDIVDDGYVAARETERTFLPAQVIGGFTPNDDLAPSPDDQTSDRPL